MIKRKITKELLEAAAEYPVVTITGPRQSGKTTLAKMAFPQKNYVSLEEPDIRLAAELDPRSFLSEMPNGAIIDEIQYVPQLLSYIQSIVDAKNKTELFILTGSHQPGLHQAVSQSLAGRTAMLSLLPFSAEEISNYGKEYTSFDLIVKGMFPRIHENGLKSYRFYSSYFQTYIERDVRALITLKDLRQFQQFMQLLAGRIGQIANFSSLSNDVGVSSTTIKNWISVLKASHILFELPPYFPNIRKRVIKSPKIYFTDTGLAAYLCNISTNLQLRRDPLRGGLYENFIILEFTKAAYNKGLQPEFYFYRDSHGNEIDLIIKKDNKLIPIEIKSAETFTNSFLKGINHFQKTFSDTHEEGFVLFNGIQKYEIQKIKILNPLQIQGFFQNLL